MLISDKFWSTTGQSIFGSRMEELHWPKVQLCDYENKTLEAVVVTMSLLYAKFDYPVTQNNLSLSSFTQLVMYTAVV